MGPHPDNLHYFNVFKDLIDEAMLNIYAAGISAREISHEFLIRRGALEWAFRKDMEQRFGFSPEAEAASLRASLWACLEKITFHFTIRASRCIFPPAS